MEKIETPDAPKERGPYSHAIKAGGLLFVAGQLPIDPKTDALVENTIEAQTNQVIANIETILKAAGLNLTHVIRTEVFLKDLSDGPKMNAIYATRFSQPYPTRQTIQAARLPLDVLLEISCIAEYR